MTEFPCPYLSGLVELTDERQQHIAGRHPELLPEYLNQISDTISEPDQIRRSKRYQNARLFTRWFENVKQGKFVIVVVVTDQAPNTRHWVVTAYLTRKLAQGEIEWQKT